MKCLICKTETKKYLCFYNLFINQKLCCKCYGSFNYRPQIIKYKKHKIKILFKYNDVFRKLIRMWKMDKEPEANEVLAKLMKKFIKKNKTVIYPPSFSEPNLLILLNYLGIKNKNIFVKENYYETKTQNFHSRQAKFRLKKDIPNKFLLIDDIYTSGKTIQKSLHILEHHGYKFIEVIVFATTQDFDNLK